jgi:DNA polymerase
VIYADANMIVRLLDDNEAPDSMQAKAMVVSAMDKVARYLEMVQNRKACEACTGLANPISCNQEFDSEEIGPWTLWQGNLDASLMIVGQDWGDTAYFLKNKGREKPNNPTNLALAELLDSIGITIGEPSDQKADRGQVFLTNAVLCLKEGGLQAKVEKDWFRNCSGKFLKPIIELVRPRVLITLGEMALRTVEEVYRLPRREFRDTVESNTGRELPNGSVLFPMYHCGRRIQNTHRTLEQQKKDWGRVRTWLDAVPA